MVREFEKAGFPIVQMCNLVPVAKTVGANRIVTTVSIPYPMGDPTKSKEEQYKLRYDIIQTALDALTTEIDEQTVFKYN
ncbi:glycine reductase [Clostridioides mangenotii]|jgi:betaine reductase|uniref:Glycine reductase n=2 Tax=Metaclostridioides mangenotii TaxID=1540 RepID=A0ABS4E781_9FIRM|nr:glycine reductase [Clostridioides mangenotii]